MTLEVVKEVVQGINSFSGSHANKSGTFRLAYKSVSRLTEANSWSRGVFLLSFTSDLILESKMALPFPSVEHYLGC